MYNSHAKGSEWRKWDLHIHTPESFHWNEGKNFKDMTVSEKNETFKRMFETINKSDIAVFAITDYWSFEGYIELMMFIEREGEILEKTIFPGMELRIEASTDYRLNMQVILSNKLSYQQLSDFKAKLCLRNIDRSLSNEALIQLARSLDNSKAGVHGFNSATELSNVELLKLGSMVAEITKSSLRDAFSTLPKNHGYILMPFDTSDGLDKLNWEDHPLEDNFFMRSAHIFETRNQKNVDLFLGRETEQNKRFLKNFQFTLGNKAKPAVCGSDAHRISDYGVFPSNKATWFKADPTFEGLKQILFEPETRVRIQSDRPEEKTKYYVIDKVRYQDDTELKSFSSDWIELNPNLNVIIGGKSSGKSLLLYHIAKTIDQKQVSDRTTDSYVFENDENFNFEVKWLDGEVLSLKQRHDKPNYQITYLPQMFIHKLSEEEGKKDLHKIILDILKQNKEFKSYYEEKNDKANQLLVDIEKTIIEFLNLRSEYAKDLENLKKFNDKTAVEHEIQSITKQIEMMRQESDLSEQEKERYGELNSYKEAVTSDINAFENLIKAYHHMKIDVEKINMQINNDINSKVNQYCAGLRDHHADEIKNDITMLNTEINQTLSKHVQIYTVVIKGNEDIIKELKVKYEFANHELKPLLDRFQNQNRIVELDGKLHNQNNILMDYKERESKLDAKKLRCDEQLGKLKKLYDELQDCYVQISTLLNEEKYKNISEDLKLQANLSFEKEKFFGQFTESLNRRRSLQKVLPNCFDDSDQIKIDCGTQISVVLFEVLNSLLNEELTRKVNIDLKTAILNLLNNYYLLSYDLIHKNDSISHMSPGKRGLVLLQVFLHLSNAQHPILIDQPEDNLDNRTIFKELNSFIKNKKIERQIIIVTHNANLVVLTDAEEVIVANQAGQQQAKENSEFRFEYVTGSLECSFKTDESADIPILQRKGIKEHACEILEGGQDAFEKREAKYGFS